MKNLLPATFLCIPFLASVSNCVEWNCDSPNMNGVSVHGAPAEVEGIKGNALLFNGKDTLLKAPVLPELDKGSFTLSAWVNPYRVGGSQQMILAKNVYSRNWRQWSLMLDRDRRFRCYLYEDGWKTIASKGRAKSGCWHQVTLTYDQGTAKLFVNGKKEAECKLGKPIANTPAPLTIGGVDNKASLMQIFVGAIDEVRILDNVLGEEEIAAAYRPVSATHEIPVWARKKIIPRYPLWKGKAPATADIPALGNVRFEIIKKHEPEVDGYEFLHGVAICRYKGTLFTCWGNNKGAENTASEVLRGRRSKDDGKTWTPVEMIGPGGGPENDRTIANSHAVFLEHQGQLWVFAARFGKKSRSCNFSGLAMEAFVLNEKTDKWESKGIVADNVWPLQEPLKMADGNWFVCGCDKKWRGIAAISHGDDLTKWDTIQVPLNRRAYTEANAWIDGSEVTMIMRNHSPQDDLFNCAAIAVSKDYGRTWDKASESDLPMTTSKPCAGILSTGQRFLINTIASDHRNRRSPLMIAVTRPGEKIFSRIWKIRDSIRKGGYRETRPQNLAYPAAIELDGKLYVVYSVGTGGNINTAELAVFPIEELAVETLP